VAAGRIQHPADELRQAELVGAAKLKDRKIGRDTPPRCCSPFAEPALAGRNAVQKRQDGALVRCAGCDPIAC
jgi:hypothetical protein